MRNPSPLDFSEAALTRPGFVESHLQAFRHETTMHKIRLLVVAALLSATEGLQV